MMSELWKPQLRLRCANHTAACGISCFPVNVSTRRTYTQSNSLTVASHHHGIPVASVTSESLSEKCDKSAESANAAAVK